MTEIALICPICPRSVVVSILQRDPCGLESVSMKQAPTIIDDQAEKSHSDTETKRIFKSITMLWRCVLPIILLLIIGQIVVLYFSIENIRGIRRLRISLSLLNKTIRQLETTNSESMKMVRQWQHQLEPLEGISNLHSNSKIQYRG